jgi:hypothetical protein
MRRIDERLRFSKINGSDWVTTLGCNNGPYWASSDWVTTLERVFYTLIALPCQRLSSRLGPKRGILLSLSA